MRKTKIVLMLLFLGFTLVGCGSDKPTGMDDATYEAGENVLDALNMYLDSDIEAINAYNAIKHYSEKINNKNENDEIVNSAATLKTQTEAAAFELTKALTTGLDKSKLESYRDDIKEALGK